MDGVRMGKDELIRSYGVSQRLAVRVGALLAKGIEVSAALLEIAGPGSAIERLLLRPELIAEDVKLDEARLARLAKETRAEAEGPLAVARTERGQLIALSEELLAEQGWRVAAQKERSDLLPARQEASTPAPVLAPAEARRLFGPDEIARLKLEALAGRDAEARVSALRKLVYAPLSDHERGGICLRALLDSAGPVRAEAIRAIEQLGFNRDTADAMQALFSGDPRARESALRRIGDLMGTLQPGERRIVLAVLTAAFREATPKDANDPLLRLWQNLASTLGEKAEATPELARVCVQHLLAEPRRMGPIMRDLLLALAAANPEPVVRKVWDEVETVTDPAARMLLLGVLIEADRDAARATRLAQLAVEELLREGADEVARQKLGCNLAALGEGAAKALMARFASAPVPEKTALVSFLDTLCMDERVAARTRDEIAQALIGTLKIADRRLRLATLNTRCLWQAPLDTGLRRGLVAELLPMVRAHERTEVADQAAALLERLGDVSVQGLNDLMQERPALPQADIAARMLGRILSRPESGVAVRKAAVEVFDFALERVTMPGNQLGGYAETAWRLAGSPAVSDARARETLDALMDRFGKARFHGDLAQGIGALAAGPRATAAQRVRAAQVLGQVVDRPVDREETRMRETVTPKGKVYHVTGRVEFDTDTAPAAVSALADMAASAHVSEALRGQVTMLLLRVWKDVAEWKTIWGPRSSEALALALARVATGATADDETRAQIIEALAPAADRQSVVRALGAVFAALKDSPRAQRAAATAALRVLEEWIEPQIVPEQLEMVLTTAAAAVTAQAAPPRAGDGRELMRRTAALLFDALRANHAWCRTPLQAMTDSPAVSRPLRKDIADRLARTVALPVLHANN